MFGYVRPPLEDLPPEDTERFRQAYCGLCHTLARRHSLAARFILNYDFTFLAILLSQRETAPVACARCPASPLRRRPYLEADAAMELAADESVILAYWQLRDGVADHGFWKGLMYRLLSRLLRWPTGGRRRPGRSLTGTPAFSWTSWPGWKWSKPQPWTRRQTPLPCCWGLPLRKWTIPSGEGSWDSFLYHLGRWVYLIDAADDLQKDAASGNYNPVALRYGLTDGVWTEESRHAFANTLDHSIHMMTTAFELADFGCWRRLLEATFYHGLFRVGRAVLDGTFHDAPSGKDRKKSKDLRKPHE